MDVLAGISILDGREDAIKVWPAVKGAVATARERIMIAVVLDGDIQDLAVGQAPR